MASTIRDRGLDSKAPPTRGGVDRNHASVRKERIKMLRVQILNRGGGGRRSAGCPFQDSSRVTAYLSHLSAWCVCVRGPAAEASTYKIWRVTPSAGVGGSALLLRVSFGGVLSPAAFVTASAAWLTLPIALVVLWVVAAAGRAPSPWKASVAVPVCGVLAPLDCDSPRAGDICRLSSLRTVHGGNSRKCDGKCHCLCGTSEELTFSPSTTSNSTVSPSPTLRRYFLGLFFLIAV